MGVSDIRFRRLGYVALNVTDLEVSRKFYAEKVGLAADLPDAPEGVFLRCSDRHHDLMLTKGAKAGLKRIGWEMESAKALDAVRAHLTEIGVACLDVPAEEASRIGVGRAFRATEPTSGATFEYYIDMVAAPSPYVQTHTKIARLGHAVINVPDREATEAFLVDHLNFRVSDRIGGMVSFMRAFPNPYHHTLGVGQGQLVFNHINFMVTEMADIGKGNNRMKQSDVPIVFGPGKHPPSESVFLYFLDPDGITVEYSYGMEEFAEVDPRPPRAMAPGMESIDYWEGLPDPRFAKVGSIERLEADQ
jgi:2,3-dihydroxy-p-cumate/2,3-dihydroxybenzoate 3,4-dioxygenase